MLLHILRAALQWALFLPLRAILILLGFLVVPLALPGLAFEGPPVAFTQAPGDWRLARLPAWAWLWSNDRDGAVGDKRGWWHMNTPFDLGAYHWFSQFWWLAIRNPANNMRFNPWFSCPVVECDYRYWGAEVVKDRPGQGGAPFDPGHAQENGPPLLRFLRCVAVVGRASPSDSTGLQA